MSGYSLKGMITNTSIEYKLNEILKYLKDDLIEESKDENIPHGFRPSYNIEEVSFTFSKRIGPTSTETVKIKLDDLQNDIVQSKFESNIRFFLSTIPKEILNQLQLNPGLKSNEIVAAKFYDFVSKEISGIAKNRIYELFVFLYEQSGHEFKVKSKTAVKKQEAKINNVKQWVRSSHLKSAF